jgi:hypothetical protein
MTIHLYHRRNQMNPQQHLDQLEAARKAWNESERILKILRTESAKPLKDLADEEILQWHLKNNPTSQ